MNTLARFFCKGELIFFKDLANTLDHDKDRWGDDGFYNRCGYGLKNVVSIDPKYPVRFTENSQLSIDLPQASYGTEQYPHYQLEVRQGAGPSLKEIVLQRIPFWYGNIHITGWNKTVGMIIPKIKNGIPT